MLSSFKLTQSVASLLVCSLLVAGLIRSTTLPANAFGGAQPLHLASMPAPSGAQAAPKTGVVDEATKARVSAAYNQLPLRFEENRGQVDKQVKYLSRGSGSTLFLTKTEAVLMLHRGESKEQAAKAEAPSARRAAISAPPQASPMSVVRMKLQGANRSPSITGEHEMSARTNYFIGNDPQQWRGGVAQYERVRYAEVYPGIDLLYYGQQQSLEYDFEVAPGADPRRIVLGFKGVRRLKIEAATGNLLLETASEEVRQGKPVVYQEVNGERREVECRYVLKGKRRVGFKLGAYDRTKRLVIDPVLTYSTYLGGGAGSGEGIAVDAVGNAYVTGFTNSSIFPILNQYQTYQGSGDAFVTKLNTNLSGAAALVYSTFLGGSGANGEVGVDGGNGIAVDAEGIVYVTGSTNSTNFPTLNQYQTYQGGWDAFVVKLNPNLSGTASLLYSTYLGGSSDDFGLDIAMDSTGNAYVTGRISSTNFPILNQYQTYQGGQDAFVARLNPNLFGTASLLYSTYLGGSSDDIGQGIAVDAAGNAYVTGETTSTDFPTFNQYQTVQPSYNGFVTRINTNLSGAASLIYSTYLGGSGSDGSRGIAVDAVGNAYVTGFTNSNNFPIRNQYQTYQGTPAEQDAFVAKLNTNLSGAASLLYSTYLGGSGDNQGSSIAVDSRGNVYVAGTAHSNNFPVLNPYQTVQGGYDGFVAKLNPNLSGAASLVYSTYLGGSSTDFGLDIAIDPAGNAYATGYTFSNNFPIRNQYLTYQSGRDAFVTKLTVAPPSGDFDADRKTDFALWHPSNGNWQYLRSLDASLITQHWGASGDKPVPGYYDQDGQTDLAVYRPSEGNWYIFQSFTNSFKVVHWGESTDIPVATDYDGDGKSDVALYRPSEGVWYILQSSDNNAVAIRWGLSEDKPVPADYDRDGRADLAVYRPSESNWYILQSSNNISRAVQWGLSDDKPVVGDYDGDERADVAVWRPTTGSWYVLRSSNGSLFAAQWGAQGDLPVPGDYDGDGKTDTAVWRPTTGYWYVLRSSDGMLIQFRFGSSGDIPVPAAYLPE